MSKVNPVMVYRPDDNNILITGDICLIDSIENLIMSDEL